MKKLLHIVLPPAISIAIAGVFVILPFSFSVFNSSQTLREQYDILDTFFKIRNITDVDEIVPDSSKVCIVDIADIESRSDIADILEILLSQNPRVIGFDIGMFDRKEDTLTDLRIATIIKDNPIIVSPCILKHESQTQINCFEDAVLPFYAELETDNIGAVTVDLMGESHVVRTFTPVFSLHDGIEIESMAARIVQIANPSQYLRLKGRNHSKEYIFFRRNSFFPVYASIDVLYDNLTLLNNRIILVGDRSDGTDKFNTPIDYRTAGVDIHAMTVDTILNGMYINQLPLIPSIGIAYLVVLVLMLLFRFVKNRSTWAEILIPLLQTLFIFVTIFIAFKIFVTFNLYITPMITLLAIGFIEMAEALCCKLLRT